MIKVSGKRRRINRTFRSISVRLNPVGTYLAHRWRRSLQLRVVVSTLTLSLIVISVLGFVLTSQITDGILEAKLKAATEEIERARTSISTNIVAVERTSLVSNLEAARSLLNSHNSDVGESAGLAGNFDPVLIVPGDGPRQPSSAGPVGQIPLALRDFVQRGQVSYQYRTVTIDGYSGPALILGTPTASEISTLELYLIFPLTSEQSSIALIQGTMFTGGLVLLVLLAAISLLVARQVVLPVRSAAKIAAQFAGGRLKERMPVRGEDDMARLAVSFNDMAESLSRQITQLEDFGNLQRRFTSDVSHELRTPLTTVRMAADLIYDGSGQLDPALRRSAELMVTELDRFESLLADLLEISRHDAGVAELTSERLDLRMCALVAIDMVRHLCVQAETELVVELPENAVMAEVDRRRVERILRNLLANAIDHGAGKPVVLRMAADADTAAVVVRDYGIGLRPGEEKLVFNRFWRSDPSRVRRSGGTGLGLAISSEDARLHNGRLEAWGELGAGANFRLTLPLVRGHKITSSPLLLKPVAEKQDPSIELGGQV
ncbi:MAG: MtrAB system histidine kinase MtrB [Mycobacteriaceae bacterium]